MKHFVKIAVLLVGMCCFTNQAEAQFGKRLLERVKREAENTVTRKAEQAVTKAVEKTIDSALDGSKTSDDQQETVVTQQETVVTEETSTSAQSLSTAPAETNTAEAKAKYDKLVADARRAIAANDYKYFEAKDRKAELNSAAQDAEVTSTMDIIVDINRFMYSYNQPQTTSTTTNVSNKTNTSTASKSTGSSSAKPASSSSAQKDPFEGKRPSNLGTSSGRVHDGKNNTFGEVSSNGEIKYKGSFVCKIDSKGVIYDRSNKVIGQVDRDGYIHKLTSSGRYDKIGRVDSNGNVYDGSSRVGQITSEIKDGSGKSLTNVLPHGVNKVHIGVLMFLNRRF